MVMQAVSHFISSDFNTCAAEANTIKSNDFISSLMETKHIKMASKGTKKSCDNCGKEFTSKQSLSRHKRNCGRSTLSSCSKCQKQFARIDSLKRHVVSCSKAKPKAFSCDICNKIFRNNWFLRRHLPCRGNLICKKCKRSFRKLKRYQLHCEECHGAEHLRDEHAQTSNDISADEEKPLFLETVIEADSLKRNIFPSNPVLANVNNTLESNDEIYIFNSNMVEQATIPGFQSDMDETKVYILDETLSFTEDSSIHPDNPSALKNIKEIVDDDELYTPSSTEATKLRNCRLAKQICYDIKTIFKEENISDESTQLDIVTLALHNLGLHPHVTVDRTKTYL